MTKPSEDPAWLQALRAECEKTSQVACAKRLGVSPTSVCLLLRGSYPGNTDRMERRVRALLRLPHECPVLGAITASRCAEEQCAPYFPDPIRSSLSKACPTCPYFKGFSQ